MSTTTSLTLRQKIDDIARQMNSLHIVARHYSVKPSAPKVWHEIVDHIATIHEELTSLAQRGDA